MVASTITKPQQPAVRQHQYEVKLSLENIDDPKHPDGAEDFNHAVLDNFAHQQADVQPMTGLSGSIEAHGSKTYDDGRLVAVELSTESYSGGLYPNTKIETMLYDAQEGKQVALPDLFRDKQGFLAELSHQVQGQLREQGADEYGLDSWSSPTLTHFSAFTPTADGIKFAFPAERSGPANAGLFEATVGWNVLNPMLDPKGPLQAHS